MRTPFAFNAFALKTPKPPSRARRPAAPYSDRRITTGLNRGKLNPREAADPGERRSAAVRAWARARWPSGFPVALTLADPEFRKA